jgi:hypothetical protein
MTAALQAQPPRREPACLRTVRRQPAPVAGWNGFQITNRVANPVLRRLLRARAGRRLGRRLAVLRYRGAGTGGPSSRPSAGEDCWRTWRRSPRPPASLGIPDASAHVAVAGVVPSVVMVRADLRPEPDEAA